MIQQAKRNFLTLLERLTHKIAMLQNHLPPSQFHHLQSIMSDMRLLKDDITFLLNKNYHLHIKLQQKDKNLMEFESQLEGLKDQQKLQMGMLKMKYQKSVEQLNFIKFTRTDSKDSKKSQLEVEKYTANKVIKIPSKIERQITGKKESSQFEEDKEIHYTQKKPQVHELKIISKDFPSQKKKLEELKIQTIKKPQQLKILNKDSANTNEQQGKIFKNVQVHNHSGKKLQFQVDINKIEDVVSEQKWNLQLQKDRIGYSSLHCHNDQKEKVEKKRSKSSHFKKEGIEKEQQSEKGWNRSIKQGTNNKKSEELAFLVGQQFKVTQFKEKYFSTDLL